MHAGFNLAALIGALKRLYRQVAAIVLEKRLASYRKNSQPPSRLLRSTLQHEVERVAHSGATESAERPVTAAAAVDVAPEELLPARPDLTAQRPLLIRLLQGFSHYLRRKQKSPVLQPQLSDRLQKSAWDHLHAAVRLARQGDPRKAQLHVDIVLSALEELPHYMPEVDYRLFEAEVKVQLEGIRELG